MALLESTRGAGHVLLSLLAGAGLRIGEALSLRWRDVDTGTGTLYVRDAKTPKGVREVHLSPTVRETLALWRTDSERVDPPTTSFIPRPGAGGTRRTSGATS